MQIETHVIRTLSGLAVDVTNPKPHMFDINDIAHSLSQQCRFGGHLKEFYSVAQHCYHTSRLVTKQNALAALMHDAAEYVLLDMPSPIKKHLTNYKELEHGVLMAMALKFGFKYPFEPEVKVADDKMLHLEHKNLVVGPITSDLIPMSPPVAKLYFLKRFKELTSTL